MKTHCILLYASIILMLAACNGSKRKSYFNTNNLFVEEEWYAKDKLKSRITYLNEEKTEYRFIAFYENGVMKDSATFVDSLLQGKRKYYDSASDLTHTENYEKGIFNGPHKAIYRNGIASFDGFHINGLKAGEWKFHHPEGNPITYEFYDSAGHIKFFVKYDNKGLLERVDGNPIIFISDFTQNNELEYKVELTLAVPPNFQSDLLIKEGKSSSDKYLKKFTATSPRNKVLLTFNNRGAKTLVFEFTLSDKNSDFKEVYRIDKKLNIQ
ncbi:MAG: hypothetical protein K9G76_04350 [Bacteroidales bacterium]|nr:hypothetical protein [Bacteroidales bacterium]MCF8403655.1 hypothetical protein [Bacteroidales bacterium]